MPHRVKIGGVHFEGHLPKKLFNLLRGGEPTLNIEVPGHTVHSQCVLEEVLPGGTVRRKFQGMSQGTDSVITCLTQHARKSVGYPDAVSIDRKTIAMFP